MQADYRASVADLELFASAGQGSSNLSAYANGAVVAASGGVFFTRTIDDAFAVVDAGAPGVAVELENNVVGRTGKSGKILVPGLRAYQKNNISITPEDLPLDVEYDGPKKLVTPSAASGVAVNFAVRRDLSPALVTFLDPQGKPLPAGTVGSVLATGERFTLGYDGQAWIKRLSADNGVTLETESGSCSARFAYQPGEAVQQFIDGVTCS